ncbi:hypothetical protein VNO77_15586 [Canavalia gladiata]|uniref:Secreted protein n=1 Tax=Canavalia gladiata TaxID=3824 RepID=A0AAN9QPA0_CANGL
MSGMNFHKRMLLEKIWFLALVISSLEASMTKKHHPYVVIPITCFMLCLVAFQHHGAHKVGCLLPQSCRHGYCATIHSNRFHMCIQISHHIICSNSRRRYMSLGRILLCMAGLEGLQILAISHNGCPDGVYLTFSMSQFQKT